MLSYVFSSGFNHLAHVSSESVVVVDALRYLGSDVRHHPSYWDRLCQLREGDLPLSYPPWPSSRHDFVLHILIAYASVGLFQTFLSGYRPIKARIGTNPLVYAADLRKTNHAIALLEHGADVDLRSLAIDDSYRISPLEVSIDRDEDVLVGELLQRGCLVTSELLSTSICLPWCSARVLVKLVYTHAFKEWAHAIGDEKLYRGIFSSARPHAGDIQKADEDHVSLARRLRQIGQDLSADSPFGAELIERALHASHTSMLEYLLPADQPPPARFLLAASTGDTSETVSIVRFLLGKGVDINVVSECGNTVLHLAAECPWEPRSLELIKMLINAGCDPYIPDSQGETVLTIAANREYQSVVKHLLSSNIFPPSNILLYALMRHYAPKIVRSLVRNGADVNSTLNGETVLHLAITTYSEPLCLELASSFVEAGCNLTICNSKGEIALHTAIKHGYITVAKLLLSQNTPLPSIILPISLQLRSPLQLVRLLIRNGADVHSTLNGETVLHLAITKYKDILCLELARSFITAGYDTTTCNSKGETVLHTAIKRRHTSVIEFLLSRNDPLPCGILPFALQQCFFPKIIRLLIHNGACVNSTSNGETVLHVAIKYKEPLCLELVRSFVEAGCNTAIYNFEGETALDTAIKYECTSVIELLRSYNVPLPRSTLPFALQQCSPIGPS